MTGDGKYHSEGLDRLCLHYNHWKAKSLLYQEVRGPSHRKGLETGLFGGSIGIIIVSKGRLDFSVRSYNTKA